MVLSNDKGISRCLKAASDVARRDTKIKNRFSLNANSTGPAHECPSDGEPAQPSVFHRCIVSPKSYAGSSEDCRNSGRPSEAAVSDSHRKL